MALSHHTFVGATHNQTAFLLSYCPMNLTDIRRYPEWEGSNPNWVDVYTLFLFLSTLLAHDGRE
jgi:hypothetical protein